MPEFILPAEADHCPHCGAELTLPPECCYAMVAQYDTEAEEACDAEDEYQARLEDQSDA